MTPDRTPMSDEEAFDGALHAFAEELRQQCLATLKTKTFRAWFERFAPLGPLEDFKETGTMPEEQMFWVMWAYRSFGPNRKSRRRTKR